MKRFLMMTVSAANSLRPISSAKRIFAGMLILIVSLVANAQDYYLTGEFNGWALAQDDCKFTENSDGTYVLDYNGVLTSGFKINDGTWSNPNVNFGGNLKLIPGKLYTLALTDNNILMDTDVINPHFVLDPENSTLLLTGTLSTIQKGKPQNMVTLSHNGELSFFTNLKALESALEAAQNGDTIYLTEGDFYITQGKLTIDKRISIIGSGYSTYLSGNIHIDMSSNPDSFMDAPLFNGLRLENVSFGTSDASIENLVKSEIRRCWINKLTTVGYAGKDVLINSCFLNYIDFLKPDNISTYVEIRNCKVLQADYFYLCNMVLNCNVAAAKYYPETMISSVFKNYLSQIFGSQTPVIWNTLLSNDTTNVIQVKDCYIEYDFWMGDDCTPKKNYYEDLNISEYSGLDGTEVGAYGGDSPFSENPSTPTVRSYGSGVEYDPDSNILKVTIIVTED